MSTTVRDSRRPTGSDEEWSRLLREHVESVEAFVAKAASVSSEAWPVAAAPGKWSPAQVAEHIALAYEVVVGDLTGGPSMQLRARWWQRVLLRRFLLPRILSRGRIPIAARAPREIRPGAENLDRAALLARVREGATRLDETMRVCGDEARVVHPYFGTLRGREILRFCAVHTNHHAPQLGQASSPPSTVSGGNA